MAQTQSFVIENVSGLALRTRINEVLAALQSANAGPIEPTDTRPGMLWFDTSSSPPVLKIRDAQDSAWQEFLDGGTY